MLHTFVAIYALAWCLKFLWDRSCGYSVAVRVDLEDYFGQKWFGSAHKPKLHAGGFIGGQIVY